MILDRVSLWLCMTGFWQSCLYLHACQNKHIIGRFTELIMPLKLPQKLNYNGLSLIL